MRIKAAKGRIPPYILFSESGISPRSKHMLKTGTFLHPSYTLDVDVTVSIMPYDESTDRSMYSDKIV